MKICNTGHPEIVFNEKDQFCPVCNAFETIKQTIKCYEDRITLLKYQIDRLNEEIAGIDCGKPEN